MSGAEERLKTAEELLDRLERTRAKLEETTDPDEAIEILLQICDALIAAHDRGAVLAGCSAGAMTLAGRHWDLRGRRLIWPLRWRNGLGIVPSATVIPHYDAWPEALSALFVLQAPRGLPILGIDEETAAVGRNGTWQVQGRGRVTVWHGRNRERFRSGDIFRL